MEELESLSLNNNQLIGENTVTDVDVGCEMRLGVSFIVVLPCSAKFMAAVCFSFVASSLVCGFVTACVNSCLGPIPTELGQLHNLSDLDLQHNRLSGLSTHQALSMSSSVPLRALLLSRCGLHQLSFASIMAVAAVTFSQTDVLPVELAGLSPTLNFLALDEGQVPGVSHRPTPKPTLPTNP